MELIVIRIFLEIPSSHLTSEFEQHFSLNVILLLKIIFLKYFMNHEMHSFIVSIEHIAISKDIKCGFFKLFQSLINQILINIFKDVSDL